MNRKKIILSTLLTCAAMASAAASGSIVMENRTDFVYETWPDAKVDDKTSALKNAAGKDSTKSDGSKVYGKKVDRPDNFGFSMNRLRTDFRGQFANDVKYRLRIRWDRTLGSNKSASAVQSLDNAVDNAFIQPKFTDFLSMRIGKFTTEGQAFEQLISSMDIYLFSTINRNYMKGLSTITGIKPTLSLEGIGDFHFTAGNTGFMTSSDSLTQNRLVYGAGYQGKFGMFEPLANIHVVPTKDWAEGQIDAGIGLRTTIDKIITVLDFQSQTTAGDGVKISNSLINKKAADKVLDFGATVQYKGENLRPQAKVFYDLVYNGEDLNGKVLGLSGAVEYFPEEKGKFRYHAAITDLITTPVTNDKDGESTSEIKVYLGVAMAMDMWKF